MYLKTKGLVLRETVYKESDKILTILTEDRGKITAKARGVRRSSSPMKAACQLLSCGEFTIFEYGGMNTIKEAQSVELFTGLRGELELLSLGTYFAQISEVLAQEDAPTPELLSLTLNSLYALSKLKKPQLLVKAAFELRAACLAGFMPELNGCQICGSLQPDRLSLTDGMLQCADCHRGDTIRLPVTQSVLMAMRYIVSCPPAKLFSFGLCQESMEMLSGITESYLSTQLEKSFSALDFYKSLIYIDPDRAQKLQQAL